MIDGYPRLNTSVTVVSEPGKPEATCCMVQSKQGEGMIPNEIGELEDLLIGVMIELRRR